MCCLELFFSLSLSTGTRDFFLLKNNNIKRKEITTGVCPSFRRDVAATVDVCVARESFCGFFCGARHLQGVLVWGS